MIAAFFGCALALAALPYGAEFGAPQPAPCLPPGIPALAEMHVQGVTMHQLAVRGEQATRLVIGRLYQDAAGHRVLVYVMGDRVAIVDEHPDDATNRSWWVDPGLVTLDDPPAAQPDPRPTCQWRYRVPADT